MGAYQYQTAPEPGASEMGTNTAFIGTHDGAHIGWQTARRQQAGLQMVPMSALSGHYDTWVPNADASSSYYPVATGHDSQAGMGTNTAFIGSSDGAHTGWSNARAPVLDKSSAKLEAALNQQLRYVSTGAGNAEAAAIFDDIKTGAHGANNHGLHKIAKHTPKDFKAPEQSLHYVSGAAGAAGVDGIFDGMAADKKHGANNHHLHKIAKHTPKDLKAKTDKLWMFNMGYEHHEMPPLSFGSWN